MHEEELHDIYSSSSTIGGNKVKDAVTGGTCCTQGEVQHV